MLHLILLVFHFLIFSKFQVEDQNRMHPDDQNYNYSNLLAHAVHPSEPFISNRIFLHGHNRSIN